MDAFRWERLRLAYPEEYSRQKLHEVAVSWAAPLIKRLTRAWQPLQEPTYPMEVVRRCPYKEGGPRILRCPYKEVVDVLHLIPSEAAST